MKKLLKLTLCLMALLPSVVWADVENKATATWLFNQYGKGETVASTSATQVIDFDGLYFGIGNNSDRRTITAEMAKLDADFKDGETVIFPKGWYTGLYSNAGRSKGHDKAANNGGDGLLSLRINRPGKLYVLCRNYNDARLIGVFKGNSDTAATTSEGNTNFQMLTVEITKSELQSASSYDKNVICHITGYYMNGTSRKGNGFKVYGVKYVVSEDAAEMSKSITIPTCGYATFSGPHTYTISSVTDGGKATAWYASADDGSNITLSQTGKKRIAPSQGFIIIGTPGKTATLKTVAEQTSISGTNLLVANLAEYQLQPTTIINNGSDVTKYNYILVPDGDSNAVFAHTTGTGNLAANKAFLRTTTNVGSGAKLSMIFDDGETTSIESINTQHPTSNTQHYNLAGQKVGKDYKGIVIVNGKKYINK
jgi:hypothetical protein